MNRTILIVRINQIHFDDKRKAQRRKHTRTHACMQTYIQKCESDDNEIKPNGDINVI